jgi:predicted nuclease of predicted toxin-antitoxin system
VKILLDEMYTGFRDYFTVLGWEAETVEGAGLRGAEDRDVARYAVEHELVLVSEDKRSTELVALMGGKYLYVDSPLMVRMIINAVEEKYNPKKSK